MSLVDYASSEEEEEEEEEASIKENLPQPSTTSLTPSHNIHHHHHPTPSSSHSTVIHSDSNKSLSNQHPKDVPPSAPIEKLPDASLLLNSPISSQSIGSDHSSRVAAAMVENASRKREANGSSSSSIRSKLPRGDLPHSKNIPDTGTGLLTPPQLRGRSNVVTEDIKKLFVQKNSQGKS